jgi:hypothetical protein
MMDGDTLTICVKPGTVGNKPEVRPKEFKTGNRYISWKFKRQ